VLSSRLHLPWPGGRERRGQELLSFPELRGILFGVTLSVAVWAAVVAIFWVAFS
jgi:hypothetical protein